MSDLPADREFVTTCIAMSRQLCEHLCKGEAAVSEAMIRGKAPRFVGETEVHPKSYVAGALLLTLCGMAAEADEDKAALLQAASLLKPLNLENDKQFSEEIRVSLEEILHILGVRKTRHLFN